MGGPESASNGTEPAPMGLADLGSSSGPFGGALRTLSFRASAAIGNVSSFNGSLGSSATAFSLQLNAFLQFEDQATQYVYWVQDVAEVDSATRDVSFLDNVWNASSISIAASALSGNGSVSGSGSSSYYGFAPACTPSTCYVLPRPGTIALALNASTSSGTPTVRFEIGSGGGFSTYDTVSFPWATEVTSFSGFEVNSSLWDDGACPRCYGDVEWVLGGPGDGYQTNLDGATGITLALDWWNGGNYEAVPSAVDYGISTAEGIGRTTVAAVGGPSDDPEANLSWGGGELHPLWAPSALSVIEVTDRTSSADGSYTVNGSTAAFDGSAIGLSLRPGPVSFSVDCNGTTFSFGTLSLEAGEVLTLEVGALPVVFVPHGLPTSDVWSVTLAGMRLNGTGNLTFGEPAGVYAYTVTSLAGYSASPSAGNVTVGVPGANVTVQFRATPSAIAGLEQLLAQYLPLLLLGVVVVAIAAIGFAVARRHGQHISSARPIRPAAPIAGVCPHCGAPLPAGPAPCGRCGWRRPPGA
ncbi:MAG TPA: thermopsin family protease [Thermoplasmata archaeon]|nr:thermopsin family protease [Thermoplasmata archaeon]